MSKRNDFVNSIKDLTETDLVARVKEDELRLKKLKFAHAISPLESPVSIRLLRKDLARLKTALAGKKASVTSEEKAGELTTNK
jgi:large subunit ribosomal protein L29